MLSESLVGALKAPSRASWLSRGEIAPETRRETALFFALLTVAALVVCGSRIAHGGFQLDDWSLSAAVRFQGFWGETHALLTLLPRRPLGAIYFPILYSVFGAHGALAWTVLTHLAVSGAFFLLLREATVDLVTAAGAALLAFLFPWSDSLWLWSAVGSVDVDVALLLFGAFVSLRSTRHPGARGWWLLALALALYMASMSLEEISLPAAVAASVLYFVRGPRSLAARRAAVHLAGVLLFASVVSIRLIPLIPGQDLHAAYGLSGSLHHLRVIADQSLTLGSAALVPFGSAQRDIVMPILLLIVVGGALVACGVGRRWDRGPAARGVALIAAAVVLVGLGYAAFLPADRYYEPLVAGIGNRTNAIAGLGFALLAAGTARLAASLLFGWVRRAPTLPNLAAIVAIAALVVGYADRSTTDRDNWNAASAQAQYVLDTLRAVMATPPPGSTVLVGGFASYTATGVPVFASTWDLNGAIQLLWNSPRLVGLPVVPGASLACDATAAQLTESANTPLAAQPRMFYGDLFVVDVATRHVTRIRSRGVCASVAKALPT